MLPSFIHCPVDFIIKQLSLDAEILRAGCLAIVVLNGGEISVRPGIEGGPAEVMALQHQ